MQELQNLNVQFFQDIKRQYGYDINQKIIEKFKIKQYEIDQYIYQIKDRGNKFYILLKGKLGVFMQINNENPIKVAQLSSGQQFGEVALYHKNNRRNQSILTLTHVTVAELDRHDFNSIILQVDLSAVKMQQFYSLQPLFFYRTLQSLGCFNLLTLGQLRSFSYFIHIQSVVMSEVIYKENQDSNFLYIVKDGQFQMDKLYPQIGKSIKKTLCIINQGQIFGEECFIYESSPIIQVPNLETQFIEPIKRYASVKCISHQGLIYRIRKQDIEERLWDDNVLKQIQEILTNIQIFHEERIELLQQEFQIEQPEQRLKTNRSSSDYNQSKKNLKFIIDLPQIEAKKNLNYLEQMKTNRSTSIFSLKMIMSKFKKQKEKQEEPVKKVQKKEFHKQLSERQLLQNYFDIIQSRNLPCIQYEIRQPKDQTKTQTQNNQLMNIQSLNNIEDEPSPTKPDLLKRVKEHLSQYERQKRNNLAKYYMKSQNIEEQVQENIQQLDFLDNNADMDHQVLIAQCVKDIMKENRKEVQEEEQSPLQSAYRLSQQSNRTGKPKLKKLRSSLIVEKLVKAKGIQKKTLMQQKEDRIQEMLADSIQASPDRLPKVIIRRNSQIDTKMRTSPRKSERQSTPRNDSLPIIPNLEKIASISIASDSLDVSPSCLIQLTNSNSLSNSQKKIQYIQDQKLIMKILIGQINSQKIETLNQRRHIRKSISNSQVSFRQVSDKATQRKKEKFDYLKIQKVLTTRLKA